MTLGTNNNLLFDFRELSKVILKYYTENKEVLQYTFNLISTIIIVYLHYDIKILWLTSLKRRINFR